MECNDSYEDEQALVVVDSLYHVKATNSNEQAEKPIHTLLLIVCGLEPE